MGPEHFFSSGMWVIPIVMMVVFALLLRFVVFTGGGPPWMRRDEGLPTQSPPPPAAPSETPLDVLKMRFAKGEISREAFEEMKQAL